MDDCEVKVVEVLSSVRMEELKWETLADPLCWCLSEVIAAGCAIVFKEVPHDFLHNERGTQCQRPATSWSALHSTTMSSSCTRATLVLESPSAGPGRLCFRPQCRVIRFPGVPHIMPSSCISPRSPSVYTLSLTYSGASHSNRKARSIWC